MPDSEAVPLSDRELDLMARTIYGEASGKNPRGQAAVGHVILNRTAAEGYPGDVAGVVLQRSQFEPWSTRAAELMSLPRNSQAYRDARQTAEDVAAGLVPDFTGGATHFVAPVAQRQLGRQMPKWAQGEPLANEGGHLFYAPHGRVQRAPVIAPAEPGMPATFEETGLAPLGPSAKPKAPSMPKAATAPDTADDDLLALYGVSPQAKPAQAAKASKPTAPTPKASADPVGLSDDALLGLYTAPAPASTGKVASQAQKPAAAPLAAPEGIVDGNTGALVVGGKPFTDNTAGLWGGFQNLANGALLGAGVPLAAGAAAIKEKLTNGGDLGNLYAQARSAYGGAQEQYKTNNPLMALGTELAGSIPTTIAATAAGGAALGAGGNMLLDAVAGSKAAAPLAAAGRFVTGGAGQGGGAMALGSRIASRGAAGAAAGAFGGAINTGLTDQSIAENALSGALIGGGIGAALPVAGAAVRGTVNKLTGSTTPEVAALARTAQDTYGIPIRAGQLSDSAPVRFLDSTLSKTPGMGYGAANATQQRATNRAIAQSFGADADRITPAVMQSAKTRLGQSFDKVAQGSWVRADNQFAGDLGNVFSDAASVLTPSEMTPLRTLVRDGILPKFGTLGEIEGNQYQALTRKGAPLDRLMSSTNPNVKFYAGQIRDALDGALERSAPAELVDELRLARRQYKNLKTVEDLAAKSSTGDISPAALMQAVQRSYGNSTAYQGGGALGDLARIGQRFLKEPPGIAPVRWTVRGLS